MANKTTEQRIAFLRMIQNRYPKEFNRAISMIPTRRKTFMGLGASDDVDAINTNAANQTWYEKALETLGQLIPVYGQYSLQKDLNKLNLERAKQGLEPISGEGLGTSVGLGLTKETRNMIYIMFGGVVLLAVLALTRKR